MTSNKEKPIYAINLKKLKKELNLTTEQLAEKIDFSVATLSSYERGIRTPSVELLIQLYEKLGINANWILFNIGGIFANKNTLEKRIRFDIENCYNLIGHRFQDFQDKHCLTDADMAEIIHTTEKRYRQIKLGKDYILIKELNYLKAYADIDMDWFLYGYVKESPEKNNILSGLPQLTPQQQAKLLKILSED